MKTKQPTPVSRELADKINQLHETLKKEFGCDFAYTIMGRGNKLAASNYVDEYIQPTEKP